jgi:hypothetical protein
MRTAIFILLGLIATTLSPCYVNAADILTVDAGNISTTAEPEVIDLEIPESFRYFDIRNREYTNPPEIPIAEEDLVTIELAYAAVVKELLTATRFEYMKTGFTIIPEYYTVYYGKPGEENLLYGFVVYRGKEPVPTIEEMLGRWEEVYKKYYEGKVSVNYETDEGGTWGLDGIEIPVYITDETVEDGMSSILLTNRTDPYPGKWWLSMSAFSWVTRKKSKAEGPNAIVGAEYFIFKEVAEEVLGTEDIDIVNCYATGGNGFSISYTDGNVTLNVNADGTFSETRRPTLKRKREGPEYYQENREWWESINEIMQNGIIELGFLQEENGYRIDWRSVPDYAQLAEDGAINAPEGNWGCVPVSIADFFGYLSCYDYYGQRGFRWKSFDQQWDYYNGYYFLHMNQDFGEDILEDINLFGADRHDMLNSQAENSADDWYDIHKYLHYNAGPTEDPEDAPELYFVVVGDGDIDDDNQTLWYDNDDNFDSSYTWNDFVDTIDDGWAVIISGWYWDDSLGGWVIPGHSFIAYDCDESFYKINTHAGISGPLWGFYAYLGLAFTLRLADYDYKLQALYCYPEGGTEPTPLIATVIKTPNENVLSLNAYENFNLENITGLNVYRGNLFNRKLITPEPIRVSPDLRYYWYVDKDGNARSNYVIEYVYSDGNSSYQVVPDYY